VVSSTVIVVVVVVAVIIIIIIIILISIVGRDSSVGIATRYGAGRSGDRIPVGRDFPHLSRQALRPTQTPI
jgi:preprotein translocase subunit SecG